MEPEEKKYYDRNLSTSITLAVRFQKKDKKHKIMTL